MNFPIDGGHMGALMKQHDWSASPLGSMHTWPLALRNALNLMLNSPESMYVVWGPQLTFFFNDAYRPILGPRLDGALGQSLPELWSDAWPAVAPNIDSALHGQATRFVDVPIAMNRYGAPEQTWWSYSYSPIHDGDTVRGVFCYTTETTARVLAQQQLSGETERLRQIVAGIPGFIWTADDTGNVTYVSPAYARYIGQDASGYLGSGWLDVLHPDAAAAVLERWTSAVAARVPYENELRMRTPDGGWRWWLVRAIPAGAERGQRASWVGICTEMDDIVSEREQLTRSNSRLADTVGERERALAASEEALQQSQKMEMVGQLSGGLAHDFNNLLASISGSLDLLDLHLDADADAQPRRWVGIARSSVRRAANLTGRLLALSRRQELAPQAADVNEVVRGMDELLHRTIGAGVAVETTLAPLAWHVYIDVPRLENALLNLCINARDAMPGGGRIGVATTNVVLDAAQAAELDLTPGDYAVLLVEDNGAGMPPAVLDKVFEPFFTTKEVGKGTGLGLSMVYGFARQAGGQTQIRSQPGHGTTVSIYLPRHHGPAA